MTHQHPEKLLRECPVCGNDKGAFLHHQRFSMPADYHLPDSYDVVSCTRCGFVYADTAGTQADYDRFYRECSKYEDVSVATGGGESALDAERIARTARDIARHIDNLDSKILDVGCANGGLLAALSSEGYCRLTGIDPSEACVACVSRRGIRAVEGGVFSPALSDPAVFPERFDFISLSHVLEHIYDLRTAVSRLLSLLEDGGKAYVEVPDASQYASYHVVPYYYFDCEHINHFDEHSLRNLFQQYGCNCLETAGKEIHVSSTARYPAVYALFIKNSAAHSSDMMRPDFSARERVRKYIEQSAAGYRTDVLEDLARSQRRIVVWGAGSYTLRLLEDTPMGKCNIVAFVDNDSVKQGKHLRNVMIYSPQVLSRLSELIVVSAALHSGGIVDEISRMGLSNEVVVL